MTTSALKILAIDDNRDNLTTLRAVVSDRLPGARVLTALDGLQGLAAARAEDPDVILLDIVMPRMDGFAVCRELKQDERLREIPVLFLTALKADRESRIRALEAGAEGFLSKPLDEIEMIAQIRAMAKIKTANRIRRLEQEHLTKLVAERTRELERELLERTRTETSLRLSEQKFSRIFQTAPYGITITRAADGGFIDVNAAFSAMTEYSREEALANSSLGLKLWVHDEDRQSVVDALRAGQTVVGHEYSFRTKSGRSILGQFSAQLFQLGEGPCILSSISDITESNRLAEEKSQLEDQLRQAQKVEAIGRLAGGVAHDFNNLTAIVLGYGEMLLGRLGPEDPSRHWVEQIVAAGQRSSTLTRQLLAFSRRQVLLPEVLDLNALLNNLEKMLGRLIGEDIELQLRLAHGLGRITADPGQIEQVVTNLVINARDAMPGGGRLTVATAEVELDESFAPRGERVVPGRYVLLTLSDTGCGIDAAAMARMFEPFYTTKERGKGTGLGLATVHGIVKQSGGYIRAHSQPGQGATFTIYLPWTDAQPKSKTAAAPLQRGGGELLLLVEDEASLRELVATVLTRLGFRVSAAASGQEALALVQSRNLEPALLLTDVIMPGINGAQLAQCLRREQPALRVLYMSGYPDEAISRHGVLAPATHFIAKPFTESALALKVHEALKSGPPVLPGRRILMIDDDEQYRELVGIFCTRRGHTFEQADGAAAALAVLARGSFDLLLVDLNIPGTSGEQVLRQIRAAGHTEPAIVLTGDVAGADLDALRKLGMALVLEKSSDARPLLLAIEQAVASGG